MNKYLSGPYYSRHWKCIAEQDNLPALLGPYLLEEADRSPLGPNTHPSSWRDHWPRMHSWAPLEELPHPGAASDSDRSKCSCLDLGPSQAIPELPMGLAEASVTMKPQFLSLCPALLSLPQPVPVTLLHTNLHFRQFPGELAPTLQWIRRWQVWDDEVERLKMHVGGRAIGPADGVNVKCEGKQGIKDTFQI